MSKFDDIIKLFDTVTPPKKLLCKHENHYIPIYSVKAFNEHNRQFHMGPYTTEEKYMLMVSKHRSDVNGEQSRMNMVWRHPNGGEIFIGNKFAVEDANFLALNEITHVLNMAYDLVKND